MANLTKIEWCDATLNLWWCCTKVSEGCKFCYAEHLADHRHHKGNWGPTGIRTEVKSWRSTLNQISKRAKAENRRLKVFCQSMSDTFEGPETMGGVDSENWKLVQWLRTCLMVEIHNHPELDFLLLTKRPENALKFFQEDCPPGGASIPEICPNLWIGTSVENQATADERIPHLLKIPAAVRYLSCEPLLGPVSLSTPLFRYSDGRGMFTYLGKGNYSTLIDAVDWVICGGESGPNARPMHPDWARSLRDQCQAAGVPFFFKQWGEWAGYDTVGHDAYHAAQHHLVLWPDGVRAELSMKHRKAFTNEGAAAMAKVGKARAGRLLDGRAWNEFPEVSNG